MKQPCCEEEAENHVSRHKVEIYKKKRKAQRKSPRGDVDLSIEAISMLTCTIE
jgi:hypothetical protein